MNDEGREVEDLELRRIQLRRLMSLAARMSEKKEQQPQQKQTPLDVLKPHLGPRGDEVLQAALEQYPNEAMAVVERLAELVKSGHLPEKIDGGDLYSLFRSLGLRVKVDTKIMYVKRGEAKDLKEFFK
ncbi:MAG: DNA-binding protein [Candidatus Caldarchaeum sp.]